MRRGSVAAAAAVLSVLAFASAAFAGPTSSTTAVVSLGDSFISGEAGRWNGNSLNWYGTRDGTDRAAYNCTWYGDCDYDANRVYGGTHGGCDRSDVAPIRSTAISGITERINIACSGARTQNIWRAAAGGVSFKNEAPQADQLSTIALNKNVKMIVLTISANDFGFADHVMDCTVAWSTSSADNPHYCWPQEQAEMQAAYSGALAGTRKAVDEIRAVMTSRGYSSTQYKLVLSGYASPIPHGANNRYPESGWSRLDTGGCPFWNADSDWAKNWATPYINGVVSKVAAEKGAQYLDLSNVLNGREVCHRNSQLVDGSPAASSVYHEWVRWVNSGCCQGDSQESLHPNAYGQRAIGRCMTLMYGVASGNRRCFNTAGQGHTGTYLGT